MERSLRMWLATAVALTVLVVGGVSPAATAAPFAVMAAENPTPDAEPDPPATAFAIPVAAKTYNVSSTFGPRCIPLPGASTWHLGVDLAAAGGAPIAAIADGTVTHAVTGTASQVGFISVRHVIDGVGHTSLYMHIWSATTHVKVGQAVVAGQRISQVGSSGGSTGNHLHLELWKETTTGAVALDPVPFLVPRGVDLLASATAITSRATPATCTYYATAALNLRTGPSTAYPVTKTLPRATAMIHVPGATTAGFIPVRVGALSGWVSAAYVTPVKPAPVAAPATYRTTAALNLRATPSTTGARILVIPKGANVGALKGSSGVWRKVTYAGKTGWVHSAYLQKR